MQCRINRSGRPHPHSQGASLWGYGLKALFVNALMVILIFGFRVSAVGATESKTILALGDSLTAGYGLEQNKAFPVQLEAALRAVGANVTIVNAGVSGDTSAGGRSRLEWLLTSPVDGVIVELGANDGLRGLNPAETRTNLDWILATLTKRNIPVLLSGMLAPPNLGADYGAEFNSIYPDLAQKYGVTLDTFFLEGVAANPDLNQRDGIHPNADGVAVIVERLVPHVQKLLNLSHRKSEK